MAEFWLEFSDTCKVPRRDLSRVDVVTTGPGEAGQVFASRSVNPLNSGLRFVSV